MNEGEPLNNNSFTTQKPWGKLTSLNPKFENIVLTKDNNNIGRQATNDFKISDLRLSGIHCRVYKDNENNFWVEDLSSNGTFFENSIIGRGNKKKLSSGDKIYLLHPTKVDKEEALGYVFSSSQEVRDSIQKRLREEDKKALEQGKIILEKNLKFQEELGEEMKCCICIDYIYQCITLIPCLHNFCASCFSGWMEKSNLCPQCREEATELKKNYIVNNIIEKFLINNPDKKRPQNEYEDMDKKNKIKEDRVTLKKPESNPLIKPLSLVNSTNFDQRFINPNLPHSLLTGMPSMNFTHPLFTSLHNPLRIPNISSIYQLMNSNLQSGLSNNLNILNNPLSTSQLFSNLNYNTLFNNLNNFNLNLGDSSNLNNNNPYFPGRFF